MDIVKEVELEPPQAPARRRANDRLAVPPLYLALGFLVAAALVSAVAGRARIPYTVALVVVGLAGGTLHAASRPPDPKPYASSGT